MNAENMGSGMTIRPRVKVPSDVSKDDARQKPAPCSLPICVANENVTPTQAVTANALGNACGKFVDAEDLHRSGKRPVKERRFDKSGNSVVFRNQP